MRCHGCHLVIGQGAHSGSGTGKNLCTLVHSSSCPGGIPESEAWRACPPNFIPPVLPTDAHNAGFQNTGTASTPILGARPKDQLLDNQPISTQVTPIRQTLPDAILRNVDALRSDNQKAPHLQEKLKDNLTIRDLRKDSETSFIVDGLEGNFRQDIPSLSAARTARIGAEIQHLPGLGQHQQLPHGFPQQDVLPNLVINGQDGATAAPLQTVSSGMQLAGLNVPLQLHSQQELGDGQLEQPQVFVGSQQLQQASVGGIQQLRPDATHQHQVRPASAQQQVHSAQQLQPLGGAIRPGGPQLVPTSLGVHHPIGPQVSHQTLPVTGAYAHVQSPFGVDQLAGQYVPQQTGVGQQQPQLAPSRQVPQPNFQHQTGYTIGGQYTQGNTQQTNFQPVQGVQTPQVGFGQVPGLHLTQPHPQHAPHGQVPGHQFILTGQDQTRVQANLVQQQVFGQTSQLQTGQGLQQGNVPLHQPQATAHNPYLTQVQSHGQAGQQAPVQTQQLAQGSLQAQFTFPHPSQPTQYGLSPYQAPVQQVLATPQHQPSQLNTKLEYRWSPTTGHLYPVRVPLPTTVNSTPSQFFTSQSGAQLAPPQLAPPLLAPQQLAPPRLAPPQLAPPQLAPPQLAPPPPTPQLASHQVPASVVSEWRYDPQTGIPYQVLVQPAVPRQQPAAVVTPQNSCQSASQGTQHLSQEVKERFAGMINLMEGGASQKPKKVLDFAKKCPAKWAKFAKNENINLPLYVYGTVSELEATLSGRADPLSDEVFLARLRHLKNVVEVCCINSSEKDHLSYGWTLAKDYAQKVENEVDQNLSSWHEQPAGVRTDFLLLAQMDFPRPGPAFKVKSEKTLAGGGKFEAKERCKTYNTCTSDGRCDYEVANPGKNCLLKHECSWCRDNLKQGFRHQVSKCRKKDSH